jgi:hypothetical protein
MSSRLGADLRRKGRVEPEGVFLKEAVDCEYVMGRVLFGNELMKERGHGVVE